MVQIEILSYAAALPDLNELVMLINSSFVAELKKIEWWKFQDRRESVCEDNTVIRFARLGPLPEFIRDCAIIIWRGGS